LEDHTSTQSSTKERGLILDEPSPAGKFLGCNRICHEIDGPPVSVDHKTGMTSMVPEVATSAGGNHVSANAMDNSGDHETIEAVRNPVPIPTGGSCVIRYRQIEYDMYAFLGSCVRLHPDLTNAQHVPLQIATTPFVEESGEDYDLGADECEEKNIEILQELAQRAMTGVGRGFCRTYGCEHDDVDECQSQIYGDLNRTTIPYSLEIGQKARFLGNLCANHVLDMLGSRFWRTVRRFRPSQKRNEQA
jgi:hypothetical protein